jgi:hypothetical protein
MNSYDYFYNILNQKSIKEAGRGLPFDIFYLTSVKDIGIFISNYFKNVIKFSL